MSACFLVVDLEISCVLVLEIYMKPMNAPPVIWRATTLEAFPTGRICVPSVSVTFAYASSTIA